MFKKVSKHWKNN